MTGGPPCDWTGLGLTTTLHCNLPSQPRSCPRMSTVISTGQMTKRPFGQATQSEKGRAGRDPSLDSWPSSRHMAAGTEVWTGISSSQTLCQVPDPLHVLFYFVYVLIDTLYSIEPHPPACEREAQTVTCGPGARGAWAALPLRSPWSMTRVYGNNRAVGLSRGVAKKVNEKC